MEFGKIGVIGMGTMGGGIVVTALSKGFKVKAMEVNDALIKKGLATAETNLGRMIKKGTLTGAPADYLKNLETTTKTEELSDCCIVIEAATENKPVKLDIFRKLDAAMPAAAVLATNTSSISITEIAAVTKRADKVIGMHFMNPVPLMKLVEIIRGIATSDETYAFVKELSEKLDKTPVPVNDSPAFAVNRLLIPMINEACFAVMENVAEPASIDAVMKLGANHPLGPLALGDLIGLDVCLAIMEVLYDGFKDPKYRPCPLLVKMVRAGYLGKKSGRGFYTYAK